MEEKKSIKIGLGTVVCIIIIILLVVLCGALYYFGFIQKDKQLAKIEEEKTQIETKNEELEKQITVTEKETESKNTKEKTQTTYESIEGEYVNKRTIDEENTLFYNLTLYKNGTFQYEFSSYGIPRGYIGSYTITENELTLVLWFTTGSDVSVRATSGTIKLTINSDGSITDNNDLLRESDNNVLLKKDIEKSKNIYIEETKTMVENLINNGALMNKNDGNI